MKLSSILLIISTTQFFSCKTELKKTVEKYPSGHVKLEYIYEDRKDTNSYVYQYYFENGHLQFRSFVKNNRWTKEKISYYETGQLERIEYLSEPVNYNDSVYDCRIEEYWENGNIYHKYAYINNKLSGTTYFYDSLSNLVKTLDYQNGKLNGFEIHYFPNKKIQELIPVKNDSAYGLCYEFNEKGDTLRANVHYGKTVDGVFTKKWLKNNVILSGSYGDSLRSFVLWKWVNKSGSIIKTLVDSGTIFNASTKKFVTPE